MARQSQAVKDGVTMNTDPYIPTSDKRVLQLIKKAVAHNEALDAIDRRHGNGTPSDHGIGELLRTAISAITCGLSVKGWDEVAQGLAMLIQGEFLVRQLEQKLDIVIKK